MNSRILTFPLLCGFAVLLSGCSADDSDATGLAAVDEKLQEEVIATYAEIVERSYADTVIAAKDLRRRIDDFVDEPSEDGLNEARDAWRESREPYLQTEVYRFYGGPIDDDDGPEGSINAWPLDEAYLDYVEGDQDAGIVNDPDVELDADTLDGLNGGGGVDENVATGYHAIEFLLWGQDRDEEGPGDRPYTDYVEDGTADHQERRGKMLSVLADLLVDQLSSVAEEWKDEPGTYRAEFEAGPKKTAISNILTGMIILSGFETGGERLQAALDSGSQEQEHSCFSDNTHRDMIQDIQGVLNVYEGKYEDLEGDVFEGAAVYDLVAAHDPDLADELMNKIKASLALAKDLDTPFDQSIALDNAKGRKKVEALVTSLREQEGLLEDVFRGLELNIPAAE